MNENGIWKKVPEKGDENRSHDESGQLRASYWKKVPEKGDENHSTANLELTHFLLEKRFPRKGTKTFHENVLHILDF